MNEDQALCHEVALRLSQPDCKDEFNGNPAKVITGQQKKSLLTEQASMFATTWNLISSSIEIPSGTSSGNIGKPKESLSVESYNGAELAVKNNTITINEKDINVAPLNDALNKSGAEAEADEFVKGENEVKPKSREYSAKISESAYELCTDVSNATGIHSAGAPSLAESFHGIGIGICLQEESDSALDERGGGRSVKKRTSSRILDNCSQIGIRSNQSSRCFIESEKAKQMRRKSSDGINGILDCSSSTVGSTHRSTFVPRCAFDYVRMIRNAHGAENDIPSEMYKYLVGSDMNSVPSTRGNTHTLLHDNATPFVEEGPSPVNKSFLSSVNDELKKIQQDQAKERWACYTSSATKMGDFVTTVGTQFTQFQSDIENNNNENVSVGSDKDSSVEKKKRTIIIDNNARYQVKTEVGMQTGQDEVEVNTADDSDTTKGTTTVWDEERAVALQNASVSAIKERNLGCRHLRQQQLYPINPEATSAESLQIREQHLQLQRQLAVASRNGMNFGNLMNINTAYGLTKYTIQAAWNTAEEIFRGYIIPPEFTEDRGGPVALTNEERAQNENNVSVSILRLLGLPIESRQNLYRELVYDMHAIQDFSVGTIQMIGSIIDWACSGRRIGTEELIAKTRLLASAQTEVDIDSEGWRHFERDIGVLTNAVTSAVGNAARVVSRQCNVSVESLRRTCSTTEETEDTPSEATSLTGSFDVSRSTSRATTRDSEYYSNPINPALIAEMVTDSEFELESSASVSASVSLSRTCSVVAKDSVMACDSLHKRASKIPVRLPSVTATSTRSSASSFSVSPTTEPASPAIVQIQNGFQRKVFRESSQNVTALETTSNTSSVNSCVLCTRGRRINPPNGLEMGSSVNGVSSTQVQLRGSTERILSREDAVLLRECRRWTNASVNTNIRQAIQGCSGRRSEGSSNLHLPNKDISSSEVSDLASAIASVATCITTALLTRAASAASYVPSFNDTFGPQVDEEYRFPELTVDVQDDSILDSIQKAASTANNILFGVDGSPSTDNPVTVTSRPSNRKLRTRNTPPGTNSDVEPKPQLPSKVQPCPEPNHNSNSQESKNSSGQHCQQQQQINDARAWQLFDYIKLQEAEFNFNKNKKECPKVESNLWEHRQPSRTATTEFGITEQTTPPLLEAEEAESSSRSISQQMSNVEQCCTPELEGIKKSGTDVSESADSELLMKALSYWKCVDNRDCHFYRTNSGHNRVLNVLKGNQNVKGDQNNGAASSSSSVFKAPQNSDVELSRHLAEVRMQDDVTNLENILSLLFATRLDNSDSNSLHQQNSDSVKTNSHSGSGNATSLQMQNNKGKTSGIASPSPSPSPNQSIRISKNNVPIPIKNTNLRANNSIVSKNVNNEGNSSSNTGRSSPAPASYAKPRISNLIPSPNQSGRSTPFKNRVKIISAVPGYLAATPPITSQTNSSTLQIRTQTNTGSTLYQQSNNKNSPNNGTSVTDRRCQRPLSSGRGTDPKNSSYLKISKQKSAAPNPIQQNRRIYSSYASRYSAQTDELRQQNGKNRPKQTSLTGSTPRSKTHGHDGSHLNSNNTKTGSGRCSLTVSSAPMSKDPSRLNSDHSVQIGNQGFSNFELSVPNNPVDGLQTELTSGSSSPPVFFPPLDNHNLSNFQPLSGIMTPFKKLQGK